METFLRILILSTFGVFLWRLWVERESDLSEQLLYSVAYAVVCAVGLTLCVSLFFALKWALGF